MISGTSSESHSTASRKPWEHLNFSLTTLCDLKGEHVEKRKARASMSDSMQCEESKPTQATWVQTNDTDEMRGGKGGKTKRGWKPCRTVPWHLCPGCCLFWTAQRQIVLLDGDYWPLGHYRLNFPWCIPANREQGIKLNYHKLEHAEREKKRDSGRVRKLVFVKQRRACCLKVTNRLHWF